MDVTTIPAIPGARKRRKRVGRGIGSGHGKTATRGTKGQRARTGSGKRPGFEGGRNPLIRRLPKRGFRVKATGQTPRPEIVNLGSLQQFADGAQVGPEQLREAGLVKREGLRIKLLGEGMLSRRLTVRVHLASASAKAGVEAAGGTLSLIEEAAPPA
jgi:large subunit ribosomal protein L15